MEGCGFAQAKNGAMLENTGVVFLTIPWSLWRFGNIKQAFLLHDILY